MQFFLNIFETASFAHFWRSLSHLFPDFLCLLFPLPPFVPSSFSDHEGSGEKVAKDMKAPRRDLPNICISHFFREEKKCTTIYEHFSFTQLKKCDFFGEFCIRAEDWLSWPPWRRRRRRRRKGFFPPPSSLEETAKAAQTEGKSTKAKLNIFFYTIFFPLALCFKNLA